MVAVVLVFMTDKNYQYERGVFSITSFAPRSLGCMLERDEMQSANREGKKYTRIFEQSESSKQRRCSPFMSLTFLLSKTSSYSLQYTFNSIFDISFIYVHMVPNNSRIS